MNQPQKFTALISSIRPSVKTFEGKFGTTYIHELTIVYDNQTTEVGQYMSQTPDCKKFTAGQRAEFTREVKQNGNYTNIVIKPIDNGQGGAKGGKSFSSYKPDKSTIIIQQKVLLAKTALEQSFSFVALGDTMDGESPEQAITRLTAKNMDLLMKTSGLDKYIANYLKEQETEKAKAVQQQPTAQPAMSTPVQNYNAPPAGSGPTPITNAPISQGPLSAMPEETTDDLPF